jgi:hypothetical protein
MKISEYLTKIIIQIIEKVIKNCDEESAIIWLRTYEHLGANFKFISDSRYFILDA